MEKYYYETVCKVPTIKKEKFIEEKILFTFLIFLISLIFWFFSYRTRNWRLRNRFLNLFIWNKGSNQ
jgi:hypothetical protein